MDHTVTASEMARAMRYASYSSANLHYGKLGRKLAEALGFRLNMGQLPRRLHWAGQGLPHWLWIMWPQVGAALEELGWISTDQDESSLDEPLTRLAASCRKPASWHRLTPAGVTLCLAAGYRSGAANHASGRSPHLPIHGATLWVGLRFEDKDPKPRW